MRRSFLCTALLIQCVAFSHNGKISYAYNCQPKRIDATVQDWQNEAWVPIDEFFGDPLSSEEDLSARFKMAFNIQEKALYLLSEVEDDSFTKDDHYELYINGIHSRTADGVASFIFENDQLRLRVHSEERDPYHAFINEDLVKFKTKRKGRLWLLEAKFILNGLMGTCSANYSEE